MEEIVTTSDEKRFTFDSKVKARKQIQTYHLVI